MTASSESKPEIPTVQEMETWDEEKLLRWIQQRKPNILKGGHLEQFKKICIGGDAFLLSSLEFFKNCDLALAVAVALKGLADEVKEEDKLSKQTAGRKRKGDNETVAPGSSNKSPKRRRQEQQGGGGGGGGGNDDDDDDDDCSIRQDFIRLMDAPRYARKRRKRIEKMINDLHDEYSNEHPNSSHPDFPLSGAVAMLSDPEHEHLLPFPMVGMVTPVRFKLDKKYCWRYIGREKFVELLKELRFVRNSPNHDSLWVYGTSGYGKSHLLAALVCYLAALGERVIYVPSTRSCTGDPIRHLQTAMLFAWTDKATQDEIITLDTKKKIKKFLKKQRGFIFVIDQMNELTEAKNEDKELKAELAALIRALVSSRKAVYSTSANYQEYLKRQISQNNDRTMHVYGGFTLKEAEQWWKRYGPEDLGGHSKKDIEDLTGRIPLLLESCVVNGKIKLDPIKEVGIKAAKFTADTALEWKNTGNKNNWQLYCDYVKACFTLSPVPIKALVSPELVDHRFFFRREDGTGGYTCGIVRKAVADELLQNQQYFADTSFLKLLPKLIDYPSATEFFMKHAVLFYLQLNGIPHHKHLANHMEVINFDTSIPRFRKDIKGKPVIYHPTMFNYEMLDGIIVFIKRTAPKRAAAKKGSKKTARKDALKSDLEDDPEPKEQLFLYPYQVTLHREGRKDSHALFLEEYNQWVEDLKKFDVQTEFIWFTGDPSSYTDHPPSGPQSKPRPEPQPEDRIHRSGYVHTPSRWPAHRESVINFHDLNMKLGQWYKEAQKGKGKEN